MSLEKGNVIKTDLSDNTMILDVKNKEKQAILFTGNQFVLASGIKENKESGKFEWDNGRYANGIKTIAQMQNNSFEAMKETISFLTEYNHKDFTKALISIETGIENKDLLDKAYDKYMENDAMTLIDNQFYDYVDESGLGRAIDEVKKEEIREEKSTDNTKTDIKKDNQEIKEDPDALKITGNIVGDVEIKNLTSKATGKPFTVASFSVAQNNNAGQVKYTSCVAYNDKIDAVKDFKKGDFVHISGQEKKSIGKDNKEYTTLKVQSVKLLKAKEQTKEEEKRSSTIAKLNKFKEETKDISSKKQNPSKNAER